MLYDMYFVVLTTGGVCLFCVVHSHHSRLPILVKPPVDLSFPGMVCDGDAKRLGCSLASTRLDASNACLVYRAVNDLQAEETAQHAVHRTASDAQAYAHDLQQQVERLQQELAKSDQRAEGDHASLQTLTAKAW